MAAYLLQSEANQIIPVRKNHFKQKEFHETITLSQMLTDMPLHLFHIQSGNIAQSQSPDDVDNSRYH